MARLAALETGSQQLQQRTDDLDQRLNANIQAHTAVHGEHIQHAQTIQQLVNDVAYVIRQMNSMQTGGSCMSRMIDPKSMAPEKFGKTHGPHWKDWTYSTT